MWFAASIDDPLPIKGVCFNFMPSWWFRNYGIEYGERMVFDPDYRAETHRTMRRIMAERFGAIHLGEADPRLCVIAPDWHNAVISAFAQCGVEYPKDNYPLGRRLPEERVPGLTVPADLWAAFPYNEIARQVACLNNKLGADVRPQLPARGVLNEAVILRGDTVLADLYADPERARRLLDFSSALFLRQLELNSCDCTVFNCTVQMVGPAAYEKWLMGYDRRIADACRRRGRTFSLHHCGKFDDFAPIYRKITPSAAVIEIGHESDTRKALEAFPEAECVSQIIEARLMNSGAPAEVGERIDRLMDSTRGRWHRLSLNIADIEYGAPDENLAAVYERLKRHMKGRNP